MRKLSAVVLIGAALGAGIIHAQTAPAGVTTRSIKAVQPGLFEVAGPRVNEALAAGITKIVAAPGKGGEIHRSAVAVGLHLLRLAQGREARGIHDRNRQGRRHRGGNFGARLHRREQRRLQGRARRRDSDGDQQSRGPEDRRRPRDSGRWRRRTLAAVPFSVARCRATRDQHIQSTERKYRCSSLSSLWQLPRLR